MMGSNMLQNALLALSHVGGRVVVDIAITTIKF